MEKPHSNMTQKTEEKEKLKKVASMPQIRVATLMVNASGVHMTYRGQNVLPALNPVGKK